MIFSDRQGKKDAGMLLKKALMRSPDAHKGECGRICVAAGSFAMTGAALLCAEAALRTGAGLVYINVPSAAVPVCQTVLKEAVFCPVGDVQSAGKETVFREKYLGQVLENAFGCDVTVIGPGMGRDAETKSFVKKFVLAFMARQSEMKKAGERIPGLVIDADALYAMSEMSGEEITEMISSGTDKRVIVTPHAGEAARLLGVTTDEINEDKMAAAEKISRRYGVTAAVKGRGTCVCSDKMRYVNQTGNSGMATAGSGDVLAGITAMMLAKLEDAGDAAQAAVFLHGLVGDECKKMFGTSYFTSGDMVKYLYKVLRKYEA